MLTTVALAFAASSPVTGATTAKERKAEIRTFALINTERAERGLPPLVEHLVILDEVRAHSDFMVADHPANLGHAGFEGRVARIQAADPGIGFDVCENVAFTGGATSLKKAARDFVRFWIGSPEHNACLFDGNGWTASSAAVGVQRKGKKWWATFIAAADASS